MNAQGDVPEAVVADRAVGAVVASAAGDALGAGYEFGPPLGADTPVVMDGGGNFDWAPGEWTDETQMALAVLIPLADGRPDLGAIERGFRTWFDSGPADVGNRDPPCSTPPDGESAGEVVVDGVGVLGVDHRAAREGPVARGPGVRKAARPRPSSERRRRGRSAATTRWSHR